MTTGTKNQVSNSTDGYLETLDTYSDLDEQLLPVFKDRAFTTARDVTLAIGEVAPDLAQDARFWLLSAMQRDLLTRRPDGSFELSDEGREAIQQPA